jgi:effector-binding domain-containing protein
MRPEDENMPAEPEIERRAGQPYVAIRTPVTMETLGTVVPPLNQEVFAWLGRQGVTPAGPPFWKYDVIDMARRLEVEAGVPVAGPLAGDERVVGGVLPEGRYVTLRHVGAPETLLGATASLLDWAANNGLTFDMSPSPEGERWGARLEIFLTNPQDEPDMSKWETQLAFRLAD